MVTNPASGSPSGEETPKPITVFLLDDHEVVRRGVRDLLEAEPDIEVVGEAGTASSALARIPALRPDVAVLDVRLPDGDGGSGGRGGGVGGGCGWAGSSGRRCGGVRDLREAEPDIEVVGEAGTASPTTSISGSA